MSLRSGLHVLGWLGPAIASGAGGWVTRSIGPHLGVSAVAHANLRLALPHLTQEQRTRIVKSVWDNLGRTAAELPHLSGYRRTLSGPGWEIEGEAVLDALRLQKRPVIFFSGHIGNWEMILPIASGLGIPVSGFYRASRNRGIDAAIQAQRAKAFGKGVAMFAKGSGGAKDAIRHLQNNGSLGILVDQKMNDGIEVPFFGHSAMTAPALAHLALRFDAAVVPVRVVRLGQSRFRMICEPPLQISRTGDRTVDIYAVSLAVNEILERWIRADPGSWLWLHRRWPKATRPSAARGLTRASLAIRAAWAYMQLMCSAHRIPDEEFLAITRALADPRRYDIVVRLAAAGGELSCSAMPQACEIAPSTMSHHLQVLEQAGLVELRRDGRFVIARFARAHFDRYLAQMTADMAPASVRNDLKTGA